MDGGYSLSNVTRMMESVAYALSLVPDVVQSIANAAKEVLVMGATRMVIPGNFPLGCVPASLSAVNVTSSAAYDGDGCLAALNIFARVHNTWLQHAVGELHAAVVPGRDGRVRRLLRRLRRDPRRGGPASTSTGCAALRRACCGAGAYGFDIRRMCGAPGTTVCADPGRRVSWDGIHLTQHAYGAMTELLFRGGLACPVPVKFPRQKDCP